MRLVDFQVYIPSATADWKAANHSLFPVYEAVRLWLKDRKLEAPFKKIVVTLKDQQHSKQWHGKTTVALGICEVTEGVDFGELLARHRDVTWTVSLTCQGLDHIAAATGWKDDSLRSWAASIATTRPPCAHRFSKLHRSHRGTACDCWFEADVDHSAVRVRCTLPGGKVQEATVGEKAGPLFLEDDFPVAKSRFDAGAYVLLDRHDRELARVTVPA